MDEHLIIGWKQMAGLMLVVMLYVVFMFASQPLNTKVYYSPRMCVRCGKDVEDEAGYTSKHTERN